MEIDGNTKIFGVFGDPISHTLSPFMHNAAFRYLKLNCIYLPFWVEEGLLGDALRGIAGLNIQGVNLTIPHKTEAMKYLDEMDEETNLIKAVNTIKIEKGKLKGYNTDGRGILISLRKDCGFNPKDKNVLIIGAGGSARAVAIRLALHKARKIIIANRTRQKAREIVEDIIRNTDCNAINIPLEENSLVNEAGNIHLLINTTSIGMNPSDFRLVKEKFFERAAKLRLVYDLIYSPAQTKLLKDAKRYHIKAFNGLGMLLYQGALSLEIWTGKRAPIHIMKNALYKAAKSEKWR